MKARARSLAIRDFILENVGRFPRTISSETASAFGISRRAINGHIQGLVAEGQIEAHGNTRSRRYRLAQLDFFSLSV
ncbi:MAG: hypothetical protein ACC700_16075, partial [Anaerolineales bacterium]